MPDYNQNYIDSKIDRAKKGFGITGDNNSHDRLPPGQFLTQNFPVLDLGERPPLELKDFTLRIWGEIENEQILNSQQFLALPSIEITKDFHCVTRWSRYDLKWKGIPFKEIVNLVKPKPQVKHVIFVSRDYYSTNVELEECLKDDVIIAYELEGQTVPLIHGGPVRMIIPQLYGWKSAKFLKGIKFSSKDEPGFWETRGYHNHADPWKEERYSAS